jgi:hypothetical protein
VTFQRLDPAAVRATAAKVEARISARFPDRQLRLVAGEVTSMLDRLPIHTQRKRKLRILRWCCAGLGALLVGFAVAVVVTILVDARADTRGQRSAWLSFVESGVNDIVFAGFAAAFLWAIPRRLEREGILKELHRLRSVAHVIDMHQLTKDPERQLSNPVSTEMSVKQTMTVAEMGRYLDYCSELLSLVSKNAALYAQVSTDSVVLDTVSEIENLTVGLSRKIWQKISLLHAPRLHEHPQS